VRKLGIVSSRVEFEWRQMLVTAGTSVALLALADSQLDPNKENRDETALAHGRETTNACCGRGDVVSLALRVPAHSQVIGSYDFNGQFELGKFIGAHMNAYDVR